MVDAVTRAPIVTLQNLLTQVHGVDVSLNSDLQARADIIKDTTGKYSDADKIKAYSEVYDADRALSTNSSTGEPLDASLQRQAFDRAIKGSTIGKAIIDGNLKLYASQHQVTKVYSSVGGFSQEDVDFFNSLSDLQKQLPQFKGYQSAAASAAAHEEIIRLSPEATNLLRAGATPSDSAVAAYQQQEAALGSAYKTAEAAVSLTPQLQQLADIVNDQTGKYSDAERVDAYSQGTSSYYRLQEAHPQSSSVDPFIIEGTAPLAATIQIEKFAATVAHSSVVGAIADARNKESDFIKKYGGLGDEAQTLRFYNSLTPLEKLLPQYKDLGTPIATLISRNETRQAALAKETPEQRSQELNASLLEAEVLFGVAPTQASGTDQSGNARAPFAAPDRLRIQA